MATADEIDPETLIPPQWGTTWTLPEAHEILIGPKNDPFCFVVFPGADSVSEIFWYCSYTQSVPIRNGPIRHTSEIFGFFKKRLVKF